MTDREIVIHLAEKVMGFKARAVALTSGVFDAPDGCVHIWPKNWNPLESIADAFEVVVAMHGLGWWMRMEGPAYEGNGYDVFFHTIERPRKERHANSETAARAICLAAVEATQ